MLECTNLTYQSSSWTGNYTFSIHGGTWLGIAGPSGGGKSTLLNLIAGFLTPSVGTLTSFHATLLNLPPHKRGVSYMFQHNTLLPNLDCRQNLRLAMHDMNITETIFKSPISRVLEIVRLSTGYLTRYPGELSGGELARMNLARAMLRPCKWLLLDEPFAAVDFETRSLILSALEEWRQESKSGILLVSHDISDALLRADQLAYISNGQLSGTITPTDAIHRPRHLGLARAIRAGNIISSGDRIFYLPVADTYSSIDQYPLARDRVVMIPLQGAKSRVLGTTIVITDSATGELYFLPSSREFNGMIYYYPEDLQDLNQ